MRTRSRSPAPRKIKAPAPKKTKAPAPKKTKAPTKARLSQRYMCVLLTCALLHGVFVNLHSAACGMSGATWVDFARSLATTGSPLCNGLHSVIGGLGTVYAQVWVHLVGVAVLRASEVY